MNEYFDNNDFNFEDPDHNGNEFLREVYEAELEQSMRWSYGRIEKMGIDQWFRVFPFHREKKIRIIENMMLWFADPAREEYEKSAYLRKGLDQLKSEEVRM
jgi:hypothetical protein